MDPIDSGPSMGTVCPDCGGALSAGTDLPPCLCELGALAPLSQAPQPSGGVAREAAALRCPGCGAFLEQGVRRCGYCAIEIAAIRCWRCFALCFAGTSHCAHCGVALGLEGDLGATGHRCPGCEADVLHLIDVGAHRIRECPACAGVMVDHETFTRLTERREAEAGMRALGSRRAELAFEPVRYRKCPICEKVMTRRNFGRRSGVIVDVCKADGIWFDPHELTAVLEFVATGGLEEARQRDIEDAKTELARRRADALLAAHKAPGVYEGPGFGRIGSASALLSALVGFDWSGFDG